MPHETYNVGCYLLQRLKEVGIDHMFGVPGDFNLRFMDDVMTESVEWIGCANELNAAYAADGYARCRGLAAMTTTGGVGELGAFSALAGSATEFVPVIQIAGSPTTAAQASGKPLHHSLGNGDFTVYKRLHAEICCAAEMLTKEKALVQIDHVITEVIYHKRPGYISLPIDVATMEVEPPKVPLQLRPLTFSKETCDLFRDAVTKLLSEASQPALLAGVFVSRFGVRAQLDAFLEKAHLPFAAAALGKSCVNEDLPNFVGTYTAGPVMYPSNHTIEAADALILAGCFMDESTTGGGDARINYDITIDLQPFHATVSGQHYMHLPLSVSLRVVEEVCMQFEAKWPTQYLKPQGVPTPVAEGFDARHFWTELQSSLRPNDIVLADMGTSAFTSLLLHLPRNAVLGIQLAWAAIGFAIPAALGMQVAHPDRRVVCVAGDGAAQMTIQEIGNFSRLGFNTIFFLMNNNGYTIERYIRSPLAPYNDIVTWDWQALAKAFCVENPPKTLTIDKVGQTTEVLADTGSTRGHAITFAEVKLAMLDNYLYGPGYRKKVVLDAK